MRATVSYISAVSLILVLASAGWAGTRISPHLRLAEEFTDNLFLTSSNETSEWITTVEPGIGLMYDSPALELDVDYSLKFRYYMDYSEGNETRFRDVQRAMSSARFFPERNFNVLAAIEVSRVSVDERGPGVDESELVNTTNLYFYSVNPQYVWQLSSNFSATFGYQYRQSDYESPFGDDTKSHEYSLLLDRKYSSSTDLRFRYSYLDSEVSLFRNYEQHTATAGFTKQYGARIDLSADGGATQITFSDGARDTQPVWNGRMAYRFSGFLSVALSTYREFTVSVRRGFTKGDTATGSLVYAGKSTVEGRVYLTEREYLEENTRDKVLGTRLVVTVPLADPYYTTVFFDYRYLKFLPDDERADRSALGATLGYAFNLLDVSLGYTFRINDSNVDANDYRNNTVLLQGSLRY